MNANFDGALTYIFEEEGGYVDNPKDPGGVTKYGITIHTLSAWRGRIVSRDDVKALNKRTAGAIYRKDYWEAINGDELPGGVDYAVLDYAVNSGTAHAIRSLHKVLGLKEAEEISQHTLSELSNHAAKSTINSLCNERAEWLKKLPQARIFGKGWLARVERVRKRAITMAEAPEGQAPDSNVVSIKSGEKVASPVENHELEPVESENTEQEKPETSEGTLSGFKIPTAIGTVGTTTASGLFAIILEDGPLETGVVGVFILISVAGYLYYRKRSKSAEEAMP